MRKLTTSVIWILAVALGLAGSYAYQRYVARDIKTVAAHAQEREQLWKQAIEHLAQQPPAKAVLVLAKVPRWQKKALKKQLAGIDAKYQPKYEETRTSQFRGEWELAVTEGSDSPDIKS